MGVEISSRRLKKTVNGVTTILAETYPSGCQSGIKACAKRMPRHCHDVIEMDPNAPSGAYVISPEGDERDPFKVWCDMDSEKTGGPSGGVNPWTVIMRRNSGEGGGSFYKGWNDYVEGFSEAGGLGEVTWVQTESRGGWSWTSVGAFSWTQARSGVGSSVGTHISNIPARNWINMGDAIQFARDEGYVVGVQIKYVRNIGGKIAFYSGILPIAKNNDGIASIMGHEIAHAVAKHSVERASRGVILNTSTQLIDIFTGGKLSQVNRVTGMNTVGLLSQIGIMNPFSRTQESEADYLGMIFSSLSGYDIRETKKLWERMRAANKGKEISEFMSTHPSSTTRIKNLSGWENQIILDYPPLVFG